MASHFGWLNLRANKSDIGIVFKILSTRSGWFASSKSTIRCPVRFSFCDVEEEVDVDNDNNDDEVDELDDWEDLDAMMAWVGSDELCWR